MTSPSFNITDADIQASLQILDSQASTMQSTIGHVGNISSSIGSAYQSTTSRKFQDQLTDWANIYNELTSTFKRVHDDLLQANQGVVRANDDSEQMTSSLSGTISGVLAG